MIDRDVALANFLGCDVNEISHKNDNYYSYDDQEYLVLTADEAYDRAIDYVKDLIDDCGIDCINGYEQYVDENYFDEMQENYYKEYCNDIKHESSNRFENRLIDECYDTMIVYPSDFAYVIDENGNETDEIDFMNCLADENQMIDNYVEYLCETEKSSDWIKGMYNMKDLVKYYPNAFDIDGIAEYVVRIDGIASQLATYDGKENESADYKIYRTN